jgi:hypothetical protein
VDELERRLKEMEAQLRLGTQTKLLEKSEMSLSSSVDSVRPERSLKTGSLRTCMSYSEPNHYCKACSTDFIMKPFVISNSDQERSSSVLSFSQDLSKDRLS